MIAMDLDNTLMHTDKTVSARTAGVLRRCREEKGILLAFVTARSEAACASARAAVQPDILVTCGGALVRCGEEVVRSVPLSRDEADAVLRFARECPSLSTILVECETGEYLVSYEVDGSVTGDYAHNVHFDFTNPLPCGVYKLVLRMADADERKRLKEAFSGLNVEFYTGGNWCFVAAAGATKWLGLQAAARAAGIAQGEIAAFGDDTGDAEMLAQCGCGVAMGNARPDVQAVARHVCGPCDRDGLAEWLEEHVLA